MKKIKLLFLPLFITSFISCNSNQEVKHMRVENVDEYQLNIFSEGDQPIDLTGEKRNYDFFNDRTIPYLSIEEYFDVYGNFLSNVGDGKKSYAKYVVFTYGKETTVINSHNKSKCVIDFNKKTATFDCYSGFITKNLNSDGPGDYISTMLDDYYFLEKTYNYTKGEEVVVSFDNYHIDPYFYDNKIYLPIHYMFALFGTSTPLGIGGVYYNGHRSYLLGGIELFLNYFEEGYQIFLQDIRKDDTTLNDDYINYNYNVLCFILDFHYGLSSRNLRSTNQTHYYNKDGAYKTLEKYKEGLMSKNPGVFDDTLIELFNNEFNDGGHTYVSPISVTQDKIEPKHESFGERKFTLETNNGLVEARKEILGFDSHDNESLEKNAYLEMEYGDEGNKEKIAYITFDNFNLSLNEPDLEAPYYLYTFNLVKHANENIRKNNIKNLVIDLTCNTGGVILAEEIFESWVCGEAHCIEYNTKDKSITYVNRKADINFDKKIDELDSLPKDVNVYCIVSPSSFSCGNLLPYRLKEFSNTKFIGSRSGGGCCSVESYINLPIGAFITISSANNSVSKDSTPNNIVTVEDGVAADFMIIEEGKDHYKDYFNRDAINKEIYEEAQKNK